MNDNKLKNQEDIKNFLMKNKVNESRMKKFEDKLSHIEKKEKLLRREIKEKSEFKAMQRTMKIQKLQNNLHSKEPKTQDEIN